MIKLVFDIDGTIRDLNKGLRLRYKEYPVPTIWDFKLPGGKTIYDYVAKDYTVLEDAPPTKYLSTVQKYLGDNCIEFWSHQPEDWREPTKRWLNRYFTNYKIKYLTPVEKEYRLMAMESRTILIDDYPKFKSYNFIILVDQPYNKNVICPYRLTTAKKLKEIMTDEEASFEDIK